MGEGPGGARVLKGGSTLSLLLPTFFQRWYKYERWYREGGTQRELPTLVGAKRERRRGFAVSIATWRVYRRPGQPGGSFTGRRNAPTFTSTSAPALLGKTVERWVDPLGLHFTKTLVLPFRVRPWNVGWTHWVHVSQKRWYLPGLATVVALGRAERRRANRHDAAAGEVDSVGTDHGA